MICVYLQYCLLENKYYSSIHNNHKSETSRCKKYFNGIIQPKRITYKIDIQKDANKFEKLNDLKINSLNIRQL